MPQFQTLQSNPTFSSQIGSALGSGVGQGIGDSLNQFFQHKQTIRALEGLRPFLSQEGLDDKSIDSIIKSGLDPQVILQATSSLSKKNSQGDESSLSNENYANILDTLEGELDKGGAGRTAFLKSYLPGQGKARESTARFGSLGTSLLGLVQKIALKQGIRNQKEFDLFVKRTIPNQSDTVDTAKGKINALRSYLGENSREPQNKIAPSSSEDTVVMIDPKGVRRLVPKSQAMKAQRAGGKLAK